MLAAIADITPNAAMAEKAPLAGWPGVVMTKPRWPGGREWVQDASAATEKHSLAAHALSLGAVWTGS